MEEKNKTIDLRRKIVILLKIGAVRFQGFSWIWVIQHDEFLDVKYSCTWIDESGSITEL